MNPKKKTDSKVDAVLGDIPVANESLPPAPSDDATVEIGDLMDIDESPPDQPPATETAVNTDVDISDIDTDIVVNRITEPLKSPTPVAPESKPEEVPKPVIETPKPIVNGFPPINKKKIIMQIGTGLNKTIETGTMETPKPEPQKLGLLPKIKPKVESKLSPLPQNEFADAEIPPPIVNTRTLPQNIGRGDLKQCANDEFDPSPDESSDAIIILAYGLKGVGKTKVLLSIGNDQTTIDCISMDRKTEPIARQYRNKFSKDIRVVNGRKYLDYSTPQTTLDSSEKTFRYIMYSLDAFAQTGRPDYILIDALEEVTSVCEMKMRKRNHLLPEQGFKELSLWKERRRYLKQIHDKACKVAKKGVLYTTYTKKDEIVENGIVTQSKDVPHWLDVIMLETDTVICCWSEPKDKKMIFKAQCTSDKSEYFHTDEIDITGKSIKALMTPEAIEKEVL